MDTSEPTEHSAAEVRNLPEFKGLHDNIISLTQEVNLINKLLEEELAKETPDKDNMILLFTRQRITNNQLNDKKNASERHYELEMQKL